MLPAEELTVICNTGDDLEHWGVHVSPDVDAVLYRLAGIFDEAAGFGILGDSQRVFEHMRKLGEPGWFRLGDSDLAHCLLRSQVLRAGGRLTDACLQLAVRLGVGPRVLPMSDDSVRTRFETSAGCLSFQEYFAREHARPAVTGIELVGIETAKPSAEARAAVEASELIVIGPSNPLISIEPILRLLGPCIDPARTLAVTPIVAGRSLKGPTVEMMRTLGLDPTPAGVAQRYRRHARWFVLDNRDAALEEHIRALGYRVVTTDTVMGPAAGRRRLAADILDAVGAC